MKIRFSLDSWRHRRSEPILWLDLGDFGELLKKKNSSDKWQDHGLGLLRTILHRDGILTDIASTRTLNSWNEVRRVLKGYRMLLMNVRSYTFPFAKRAATIFKELNPDGLVLVGGMHATVAPDEMAAVGVFDRICRGPGEGTISDLVKNPQNYPRQFDGVGARSMADWPDIDRTLWPKPASRHRHTKDHWPLEPSIREWGPGPYVTMLTSRVCPWQCSFCNEMSYIAPIARKPVDAVIDELNRLDDRYGIGSVVFHDSMFFQSPGWLEEWIDKYPRRANRVWPYWAAARTDTVRAWPELFEALIKDTNWHVVSIGFESGSDRMLRMINKECTAADHDFAIQLLDRINQDLLREGRDPALFFANIMLGIPGETREDAFQTIRMLRGMKWVHSSITFFAPYPGSALGNQLIAEGKSLMGADNYHRFPGDEKVKGVDYGFYRELLAGRFDDEIGARAGESLASQLIKA